MTTEEQQEFNNLAKLVQLSRKRLVEVENKKPWGDQANGEQFIITTSDMVIEESLLSDEELEVVKSRLKALVKLK